ncbi:MAG UNVERIFIED_CONTAM: hypothetical protein LVR18_35985 [Planctomycetaceae bacterium]
MTTNRETEIRERMTRHWLATERSVRACIAGAVSSFADREDLLQQVALTVAASFRGIRRTAVLSGMGALVDPIANHRLLPRQGQALTTAQ